MDPEVYTRTEMLIGKNGINKLTESRVAVFGIGGVGGHATEVLARSGVGHIDLFDNDSVSPSNINRQIFALQSTIGKLKVDVAENRILDINPECVVKKHALFYLPSNADQIDLSGYDYVLDCIDTISAKIELIKRCKKAGTPIISSMGAANKMDPTAFKVVDIFNTKMDPIAKIIRKKMRECGIKKLKVVSSEETPIRPLCSSNAIACNDSTGASPQKHTIPASNAFVPASAGIIMGGEVIKDLIGI